MKDRFLFYFFLVLFLISTGCKKSSQESKISEYNVNFSKEEKSALFEDFFEVIKIIPLETMEENIVGNITNLYISEDKIYIFDIIYTRSLFVFDMSGKFLHKIGRTGNGPGEYQYLMDFILDENQEQIILLANGNKLIYFTFEGKFIKEEKLPENLRSNYFIQFPDERYVFGNDATSGDDFFVYFLDKDLSINKKFIPIKEGYEKVAIASFLNYSGNGNNYLFVPPVSPVIYEINKGGCFPKYEFMVSEPYKLTEKKLKDFQHLNSEEIWSATADFFMLSGFFDMKQKLFVTYFLEKEIYWGSYDREKNEFKYVNKKNLSSELNPDFANIYFLTKIDDNTLGGIFRDPEREEEGLNPSIVICRIKEKMK